MLLQKLMIHPLFKKPLRVQFLDCALLFFLLLIFAAPASAIVPDRRKDQFSTETAWYIIPAPFSVPGLGSGVILAGMFSNIANTHTDAAVAMITGDLKGKFLGLMDMHLIDETLVLDLGGGAFDKANITAYNGRGFNTDPKDFNIVETGGGESRGGQLSLMLFKRHFQLSTRVSSSQAKVTGIRDSKGNLIVDTSNSSKSDAKTASTGIVFDLTDDWFDPRVGLRQSAFKSEVLGADLSDDAAVQYTMDYNTTLYIPLGSISTWAFNYYRSDAVVTKEGLTDTALLEQKTLAGNTCSDMPDPVACQATVGKVVNDAAAGNKYGTASGLGGVSRLRAVPQGRFRGAHTLFYGSESRWNLTDEKSPFNLWLIKDIRTSLQFAFFYETGSIADVKEDLGQEWRTSKGMGFRVVTESGMVVRLEGATGEEGSQGQFFFSYPWADPVF